MAYSRLAIVEQLVALKNFDPDVEVCILLQGKASHFLEIPFLEGSLDHWLTYWIRMRRVGPH